MRSTGDKRGPTCVWRRSYQPRNILRLLHRFSNWLRQRRPYLCRKEDLEAEAEFESNIHPVIGGFVRGNIADTEPVCRANDVLQGSADPKIVVTIQEITHVCQAVATPAAARRAAIATRREAAAI